MRHGGQILVDHLKAEGVRRVFSVPGESFLAALDGLYDSGIQNVVCRHEGGASMMAEAHAKLTGEVGIAFVTRGPGATNASSGIHVAQQDSTPMILFVGQIDTAHRDREAFQEVDYRRVFGGLAKWATEVDDIRRLPEYLSRAFHLAQSGRPGPVVLALPEDMLSALSDVPDLPPRAAPLSAPPQTGAVWQALKSADKPLLVVGGPHWSAEAARDLAALAEASGLPVAVTFRRQDRIDNRHPNYAGDLGVGMNPKLGARLKEADLLLIVGARLGDTATNGYDLVDPAAPGKVILHIHSDPDELGHVWRPDLAMVAKAPAMIAALKASVPQDLPDWSAWTQAARADYEAFTTPRETPGAVKLEQVMRWLSDHVPEDAIATNGAGNYAAWMHRYFRPRAWPGQLAPTSGSMGYGFPAAIAASLEHPEKTVLCFAGDGCFQMTLNELSTARQHGATPIVILANNGRYGTIRAHQERTYPARVSGTELFNPDYAALVRSYGGHGETVRRTEDFAEAFARARASGKVAVIELILDPEALSPGQDLSAARAQGERAQGA
ncbi:thiamine pyrophosphate-binding protein [Pararhodobacter aggregans]|uniref:Thiamine pyrophosphate-binding protein n=1 Tax=Pararhodobacter aggregans TaxID=404875 RepID=A0A2T7UNN8_9RHOB|nr:thiamine pyrophosphate-binding protein [Pararhodobacter aggregans]PTX00781.1 acetolactate synthase-1/2/3 large subunit [Pararhodobacter aggregans]PVE46312.1 thiamine pyrophosphate-binding protein [Pararhodobacter aggregans]